MESSAQLKYEIWNQVYYQLWEQVHGHVWIQVSDQVKVQVWIQLYSSVCGPVLRELQLRIERNLHEE